VSALAELEQVRGEVGALEVRATDLDRARGERGRNVQVVRGSLADFLREREAGALDGDLDAREAELVEAVREAESGLSLQAVTKFGGGEIEADVVLEPVDELAEARYEGAQEALQAAKDRLAAFASANMDDLQEERLAQAAAARAALIDADRVYRLAAQGVQGELDWQTKLANDANRPALIAKLPQNPGAWIGQAPSPSTSAAWGWEKPSPQTPEKVALPMPETYWP
jgi:hypothetical protein